MSASGTCGATCRGWGAASGNVRRDVGNGGGTELDALERKAWRSQPSTGMSAVPGTSGREGLWNVLKRQALSPFLAHENATRDGGANLWK